MDEVLEQLEYMKRLVLAVDNGMPTPRGELSDLMIQHDDDCPILKQVLSCHCNPTIEVVQKDAVYRVFENGKWDRKVKS